MPKPFSIQNISEEIMPYQFENIIFHLDHTVINKDFPQALALYKILKKYSSIEFTIEELASKMKFPKLQILQECSIEEENFENVIEDWIAAEHEESKQTALYPEIESLIEFLKQHRIPCSGITLLTSENLNQHYSSLKIGELFQEIYTADIADSLIGIWDYIITENNINTKRCLFIGSTFTDYTSIQYTDIRFGLARWGVHSLFDGEYLEFNTPEDIKELFKQ
ncbi:MAG: HAD family hydrolase [Brevinemataceae bacterium]